MLDNGADIRYIQQMLGHVSIGTTEIYTHVSIVQLKKVQEMTHPTMHGRRKEKAGPEATEYELLATLDTESEEDSDE
jgi:integrase/recombinase XerD